MLAQQLKTRWPWQIDGERFPQFLSHRCDVAVELDVENTCDFRKGSGQATGFERAENVIKMRFRGDHRHYERSQILSTQSADQLAEQVVARLKYTPCEIGERRDGIADEIFEYSV